jgi:hypothetical protein
MIDDLFLLLLWLVLLLGVPVGAALIADLIATWRKHHVDRH